MGNARKFGHTAGVFLARPLLFFCFWVLAVSARAEGLLPHARVPRLLRLVDARGVAIGGECFAPQFSSRGDGLFFTRADNWRSARSLWFASPLVLAGERYPAWRAVPVWPSNAPPRLIQAVQLRGNDATFLAIGAEANQNPATQLWRVEALIGKRQLLWSGREPMSQLAPSPDGKTLVFTRYGRDKSGRETPQLWRLNLDESRSKPALLFPNARRAVWLDSSTLVFERIIGRETSFFALNPFTSAPPRFLLRGSGEGAALSRGEGLVFAARAIKAPTTSLFVLARDGSGLHAFAGTEGARHPGVAQDGTQLSFDAPDPRSGNRALWLATLDSGTTESATPTGFSRAKQPRIQVVRCELEPMPLPPPAPASTPAPRATPLPTPLPLPTSVPQPQPEPSPAVPSQVSDKADMDVAGTLAKVGANARMRATFWAKNRGTRPWTPHDVRVVVRWIDFEAGTRRRWEWKWMRAPVPPLGQTRFPLDLVVPSKPGRYKIIYGLIRLNSKGAGFSPPPYNASQESWPGEFAATAFAVTVN